MSRFCPVIGRRVVYLECLECEEKECEKEDTFEDVCDGELKNSDE